MDIRNPAYSASGSTELHPWDLPDQSFDMVTALSVWTHMSEDHARFYLKEVGRVLRPGERLSYLSSCLMTRIKKVFRTETNSQGRFHMTPQKRWIFDEPAYESEICFHPKWAGVPEEAIGITHGGVDQLLADADLKTLELYPGNWKEIAGLYFQDVVVVQKAE